MFVLRSADRTAFHAFTTRYPTCLSLLLFSRKRSRRLFRHLSFFILRHCLLAGSLGHYHGHLASSSSSFTGADQNVFGPLGAFRAGGGGRWCWDGVIEGFVGGGLGRRRVCHSEETGCRGRRENWKPAGYGPGDCMYLADYSRPREADERYRHQNKNKIVNH